MANRGHEMLLAPCGAATFSVLAGLLYSALRSRFCKSGTLCFFVLAFVVETDHSGIRENDFGLKMKRLAPDFQGELI
jgi:hypothetical protein